MVHDGAFVAFAHTIFYRRNEIFRERSFAFFCTYRPSPKPSGCVRNFYFIWFPCEVWRHTISTFDGICVHFESNRHSAIALCDSHIKAISFVWRQFISILLSTLFFECFFFASSKKKKNQKKLKKKKCRKSWKKKDWEKVPHSLFIFWLMEISWLYSFHTRRPTKWKETFA